MTLYPHQEVNARRLYRSVLSVGSGLDASDAGTGKSFTALAVASLVHRPHPLNGCLRPPSTNVHVICPLGVGAAWEKKATMCGVPITWTNYEKARRPGWKPPEGAFVIFDEVHRCKSPSSAQSELLARVSTKHKTLLLSATPFESPLDTRAVLHVLRQTHWSEWYAQLPGFDCYRNKFRNNAWTWRGSPDSIAKLHHLIAPHMVKTSWREVDGYPELHVRPELVDVRDVAAVQAALEDIAASDQLDITKSLKQRMFVESAKVDPMSDMAVDYMAQGRSVIGFFNFTESLRAWADLMGASIIDGSVSGTERAKVVEAFQNAKKPTALAVNIRAGGEGIDLHDTVGVPRVAMHCPTWSARDFLQCVGRTHRVGAKSLALHLIMFAGGTVDTRVMDKLSLKTDNINAITDADLTHI